MNVAADTFDQLNASFKSVNVLLLSVKLEHTQTYSQTCAYIFQSLLTMFVQKTTVPVFER